MCGLCGVLSQEHWADAQQIGETVTFRHARERRAVIVSKVLASQRAKVVDWQGAKLRLATATGRIVLSDTLADLWHAVDGVMNPIDPLDPKFLKRLEEQG